MAQEKLKVTIRFNDELKDKLQQKAKEEDLSLNQLVVKACKKLIKEMEKMTGEEIKNEKTWWNKDDDQGRNWKRKKTSVDMVFD